jgi:phage gp36-like protein
MPYLLDADYSVLIRADRLDTVLVGDSGAKSWAERMAQAQMESYLRSRYNVAAIFSAATEPADLRHPDLVMYLVDMVLYHLHSRVQPRNIPELRQKRYDDALAWLEMVASGKLSPNLPDIPEQEGTGAVSRFGSDYWGDLNY